MTASPTGEILAEAIEASDLTQKEIADRIGMKNANVISMMKQGIARVPLSRIPALSETLELVVIRQYETITISRRPLIKTETRLTLSVAPGSNCFVSDFEELAEDNKVFDIGPKTQRFRYIFGDRIGARGRMLNYFNIGRTARYEFGPSPFNDATELVGFGRIYSVKTLNLLGCELQEQMPVWIDTSFFRKCNPVDALIVALQPFRPDYLSIYSTIPISQAVFHAFAPESLVICGERD